MHWAYILRTVGALVFCIGLTMFLPLGFALFYQDGSADSLALAMSLTLVAGAVTFLVFRNHRLPYMSHRDGITVVALGWIVAALVGALPFWIDQTFVSFTDCVFESISGFSTTGASVLTNIEIIPRGILMWRSLTHWLGGMGIIVLFLAILPFLGVGGMQLYKAEAPGPSPDKLTPRIRDTASALWRVYLLFSLALTILLMLGGMDLFDGICHTFGTMATGGFSTRNASIGHYNSVYIDTVITIFMLIAGVNFALHYQMLLGKPQSMFHDPEFRFFMGLVAVFILVTTICLAFGSAVDWGTAFRLASFQVASIISTTGYATADFELWPTLPQSILLFCMFLGGCAGSTAGGMKCMRIMLLLKQGYLELFQMIHPRAVTQIKFGRRMVTDDVMKGIWGFFILFLGLFILAAFLLAATGLDLVTSFSAVAACIGNIGPGLGTVGPAENYAHLPLAAKWVLSVCMLMGRLEIYTVVVLLVPEFWRK